MLEKLFVFQTSGLPLFTWVNPLLRKKKEDDTLPSEEHISALISAMLLFSQSTLKHKMESIGLDHGGFLSITTTHDIVFVGIFSEGDSKWRAHRILRKIRDQFWKMYGNDHATSKPLVFPATFEAFNEQMTKLLKWSARTRSYKMFLSVSIISSIILVTLIGGFKLFLAPDKDLLTLISEDLGLYFFAYFLFAIIIAQYILGGPPNVKIALLVAVIEAFLIDAVLVILWPETPFFFLDILDAVISTGFLIGFVVDRVFFLEKKILTT